MEQTLRNISQVTFIFFVLFGVLHISSSMLAIENTNSGINNFLLNNFDLPFLLAGLIYGFSRLSWHLGTIFSNFKIPIIICGSASIIVFLIALYFNFLLANVQ